MYNDNNNCTFTLDQQYYSVHVIWNRGSRPSTQASYTAGWVWPNKKKSTFQWNQIFSQTRNILPLLVRDELNVKIRATTDEFNVIPRTQSIFTFSLQVFLLLHFTPTPPYFYRLTTNQLYFYSPDAQTISICHVSPHQPGLWIPERLFKFLLWFLPFTNAVDF